jgi:hypothetical protein
MKFLRGQKYGLIWELSENTKGSRVFKRFSKAADGGQISTLTTARKLNRSCRSLGSIVHMEGLQIQNFISEFKSFGGNKPTIKIM